MYSLSKRVAKLGTKPPMPHCKSLSENEVCTEQGREMAFHKVVGAWFQLFLVPAFSAACTEELSSGGLFPLLSVEVLLPKGRRILLIFLKQYMYYYILIQHIQQHEPNSHQTQWPQDYHCFNIIGPQKFHRGPSVLRVKTLIIHAVMQD